MRILVYWQPAHYTKTCIGRIICDPCVSVILHVISLANRECSYTITLVINMTTDSNDMYLVSWGSVCSVRPSITQHYWLIAIHKTYWIPSHLHAIVNTEHIITKQKLSIHDSKLSLTKSIIFSHLYPRSAAPQKAPSSAKCNVHFSVPRNWKGFTKPWRLNSL